LKNSPNESEREADKYVFVRVKCVTTAKSFEYEFLVTSYFFC
jgi:hypothetical protein